jgi:hypothetical protein
MEEYVQKAVLSATINMRKNNDCSTVQLMQVNRSTKLNFVVIPVQGDCMLHSVPH